MNRHLLIMLSICAFLCACSVSKDLSKNMSQPRDQGNEGTCVGFAVATVLEYPLNTKKNKPIVISARHIYNSVGEKDGSGAVISDALDFLKDKGAVEESVWPYVQGESSKPEPASAIAAQRHKIKNYFAIHSIGDKMDSSDVIKTFKKNLKENKPIIGGIKVYKSLWTVGTKGIYSPKPDEKQEGGQAVVFVGYNDKTKLFKFRNSWGAEWADHGYAYIPYSELLRLLKYAYIIEY